MFIDLLLKRLSILNRGGFYEKSISLNLPRLVFVDMSISRTVESPLAAEGYRSFRLAIVSTCVEATKYKYESDLEAIEVDISSTASVADNENIKSNESVGISRLVGLSTRSRMATIMPWASNKPAKPIRNPMPCF